MTDIDRNKGVVKEHAKIGAAGLAIAFIISVGIQIINATGRGDDKTFYYDQPIIIFSVLASIWLFVVILFFLNMWESTFKCPAFSYRMTVKNDKHQIYLLANGKIVDSLKWKEMYNKKFDGGYSLHNVESNYSYLNIEKIEDAIERGNKMVEDANKRFNPATEQVLIKDSAKSLK